MELTAYIYGNYSSVIIQSNKIDMTIQLKMNKMKMRHHSENAYLPNLSNIRKPRDKEFSGRKKYCVQHVHVLMFV